MCLNHSAQHSLLTNWYKNPSWLHATQQNKIYTRRHNTSWLYVNSESDSPINAFIIHILHTHKNVHLTHLLRQQVNILFVAALWSIVQLYQSQSLWEETELGHHDNSVLVCIRHTCSHECTHTLACRTKHCHWISRQHHLYLKAEVNTQTQTVTTALT